jgi:hypothetical protein
LIPREDRVPQSVLAVRATPAVACGRDARGQHRFGTSSHGTDAVLFRDPELLRRRLQLGVQLEMNMRVDESRHDHSPGEFDSWHPWIRRLSRGAHGHDPTLSHT